MGSKLKAESHKIIQLLVEAPRALKTEGETQRRAAGCGLLEEEEEEEGRWSSAVLRLLNANFSSSP